MSEPRFRALDAFAGELDRAIAREQRRRVPRLRALGPLTLALLATLCVTGVAAAASFLLTGSPIPGAHTRDVPDEATPLRETARLMGLDAPDPGGGRPWDLRVSRSRTGQLCTAVGQVADGRLGIVGLDGRFRTLPQLGYDTCGQDLGATPALLGARVFDAPRREDVRTVVSGVAGTGVTEVIVDGPGGPRALELGPGGTFVTVYAGYPEDVAPVVRVRGPGRRERTIALAADNRPRAHDPAGEGSWTVSADRRAVGDRKGQTCAQVQREHTRDAQRGGMSYPVCGDLRADPFFFAVAALPRAEEIRNPRQAFPWGLATPRTMVWGAARDDVRRITINGTSVDLSGPGFVAAFPEGTRPAELTVEVTLASGETRRLVGPQNLRAADGARETPTMREPVHVPAAARQERSWLIPRPSTARVVTRVKDPAGGADWAVRTFTARVRDRGLLLRCAQLGRLEQGRFVRPGGHEPLALDDALSACSPRGSAVRREETFVDDARAYAPRPTHTIVWGLAGRSHVKVGSRRIAVASSGAFLAFFAPELTAGTIAARAPDPDGGAPYGLLEWRMPDGALCRYAGRIVADTVGTLDPRTNRFQPYPVKEGGSCDAQIPPRSHPVSFSVGGTPEDSDPAGARLRRTLPGRTIISGFAHPEVKDITIQTPRDIRTLRPAGANRAFLVVYDGGFFSGTITVTARFADGSTRRQELPVAGP